MRDFLKKLMKIKGIGLILMALAMGILLIVLSEKDRKDTQVSEESFSFAEYERDLEERLEDMISRMDGVSSVSVMILLDCSYQNAEKSDLGISYSLGTGDENNSESDRIAPKVRGAAVVCRGAEDPAVRQEILSLLSSLLNLSTAHLYVGTI